MTRPPEKELIRCNNCKHIASAIAIFLMDGKCPKCESTDVSIVPDDERRTFSGVTSK